MTVAAAAVDPAAAAVVDPVAAAAVDRDSSVTSCAFIYTQARSLCERDVHDLKRYIGRRIINDIKQDECTLKN
jgi:hypothetical protein